MSLLTTASLVITPNAGDEGTLYSVIPSDGSGDMSVVRATTATRVNSAGLVELVPYNLLQYSEQFNNGVYNQSNVSVTSNSTIAPNGTTTADTITDTASSGLILQTSASVNEGATVTLSQYCKRSNNDWIYLGMGRSGVTTYGEVVGFFNLATGATGSNITYGAGVFVSLNIENVGNGWYRCSLTAYVSSATAYVVYSGNANANGVPFVSDIGDARFQWGAQLVEGSTAKDYQRTETRLNIPRLDYSNGTCPSLLVEPQRTNVLKYSEDFTNGVWGLYSSGTGINPIVTANTTISPSGILNADTIVLNAGAGTTAGDQSQIYQTFPITNGNIYTFSFYAKGSVGGEQLMIRQAAGGSYTKITLTNQWVRYQVTETATYSGTGFLELLIRRGLNEPINSSATFYAWGAQMEQGSYPTSYIPTTSASVTRNADVVSKTGISSLIGQTEGTLFYDIKLNSRVYYNYIFLGIASTYIGVYIDGSIIGLEIVNGTLQTAINYSNTSTGQFKIGIAYKNNDIAFYVNGILVGTDNTCNVPTVNAIDLTFNPTNSISYNAVSLWKTRLTNTQLAQLTTI